MKALALLLATVPLLGGVLATLFILFLLTFPWENSDPTGGGSVVVAVGIFLVGLVLPAAVCWFAIAAGRFRLAKGAFAIHAIVAGMLLLYGLSVSDHGDGQILSYVVPIEACGLLAVAIASKHGRKPLDLKGL
jgi:hypothetical protein